jgi:hypothetical protein
MVGFSSVRNRCQILVYLCVCSWVYNQFSSQFSQQLLFAKAWYSSTGILSGGFDFEWIRCQLPVSQYVCPQSLLYNKSFLAVSSSTFHHWGLRFYHNFCFGISYGGIQFCANPMLNFCPFVRLFVGHLQIFVAIFSATIHCRGLKLYHILRSVSAPIQLFCTWWDSCLEQAQYRPEGEITHTQLALLLRVGITPKFWKQFIKKKWDRMNRMASRKMQ